LFIWLRGINVISFLKETAVVTVTIAGMSFPLDKVSDSWVSQMLAEARKQHQAVCVRVHIDEPGAQLTLATSACSGLGGGSRRANPLEERIIAEWQRRELQQGDFPPGKLHAFLHELPRLL
jgi:hypothetical protein